ncbi:MAG: hypothetical protein ACH350_02320 [Parachlamydiaceae bacterium]
MNSLSRKNIFILIIFLLTVIFILTLSMTNNSVNHEFSDHGKMLFSSVRKIGLKIGEKYGMTYSGAGGGAKSDGIWLMSLSLERKGDPLSENDARRLIIKCVNDFLAQVNSDEKLEPFLKNHPFKAANLALTIFNHNKDSSLHFFPYISVVTNSKGKIGYFTEDPSTKHGYHTEKYETYEEAVAILSQNKE